ncbi:MAG: hypothetical protein K6G45_05285 [Lachnospiraceae bacterium]|nr:hypothetical protein [Lachnospiraceae bacterium]
MRKLASIQRIWKIEPIEGADRIELANVLGWQSVVNRGQFRPMEMIRIDESGEIPAYMKKDGFS